MKAEFVIIVLWLIAIVATFLVVDETGIFTSLGPVFAICMIGSVITVQRARELPARSA